MISFFSILFILIAINALLLIFSVNHTTYKLKKPLQKNSTPKLYPEQYKEPALKEAV